MKNLNTSVLAMFDKDGNKIDDYVNYHGVSIDDLKGRGAYSVALYVNNGNGKFYHSLCHAPETALNVKQINKVLAASLTKRRGLK